MAGSLISSLTRVFMPRLRRRNHSGVVVLDMTGKAQRFGETLAHELKPEGIDVLTLCAASGQPPLPGPEALRGLARATVEHMSAASVLRFDAQGRTTPG